MRNKTFAIDDDIARGMEPFRNVVDWDSVVALAIRTKLKLLAQTSEPRAMVVACPKDVEIVPEANRPAPSAPVRRVVRRQPDPSPEEILQRAAEVRAGRL